jgi:alanine racemase
MVAMIFGDAFMLSNFSRWIEVSERSLLSNVASAQRAVSEDVKISAVVKANAYGHGVANVVSPLERALDVDSFSVVSPAEAAELRSLGVRKAIIVLGCFESSDFDAIVGTDSIPFVCSPVVLERLSSAAAKASKTVRVILKIDTGMGRLGAVVEEAGVLASVVAEMEWLELAGFATHFAMSDVPGA